MGSISTLNTTSVTNHGLFIQTAGSVVGAITKFTNSQSRGSKPLFEFGQVTAGGGDDVGPGYDAGEPFEIVGGNISGTTINIDRYDIYTQLFETAFGSFGTNGLEMLTKQDRSIRLIEFIKSPGDANAIAYKYIYYGVWFTRIGRQHSADGDRVVMTGAEAVYTRRRKVG